MTFAINQIILSLCNLLNVQIDAYEISKNRNVGHTINFIAYGIVTGVNIYLFHLPFWQSVITCFAAFFNRQITFDIPLNLRRHLSWDYVTKQNPPGSILDRIEIRLFGYNGKAPTIIYALSWTITILINYLIY
jgi:hypothetical protein